jgi:CBS domain-containing protein
LGFPEVCDYVTGKLDWLAMGLPTEGREADKPAAKDVARTDIPTCGLADPIGDVSKKAQSAGVDICVVVNDHKVVLGLLRAEQLAESAGKTVGDVMRPGPSTFRPHVPIQEMANYLTDHDMDSAPLTTADGRLIGVLFRSDAERAAKEL